jgi:hypothetical protein
VSVKASASPVRYRSTRVGAVGLGAPARLRICTSSVPLGGDACAASISGRSLVSGGPSSLGGDGPSVSRRDVVATCSASFDRVGPVPVPAAAAVASAVRPAVASAFPERAKVVALVAAIMLLCNADRVVMSVAVVPMAAQYGWSSSFVGIVQVSTGGSPRALPFRLLPSPFFIRALTKSRSKAKGPLFSLKLSNKFAALSLKNKMFRATKSTLLRHVSARRDRKTTKALHFRRTRNCNDARRPFCQPLTCYSLASVPAQSSSKLPTCHQNTVNLRMEVDVCSLNR